MTITHVTVKAPGQRLFSVADWNSAHATPSINLTGAAGNTLIVDTDVLVVDATNDRVGIKTASPTSPLSFGGAEGLITMDTTDGSDNTYLRLTGGGGGGPSRGAYIDLFGNEHGSTGTLTLGAGTVAGGNIDFKESGNIAMRIRDGGNIGIGTLNPAISAILDLFSTTGALLLTRMTTAQKNALTAIDGMLVYDSTLNKFQGRENGAWVNLI